MDRSLIDAYESAPAKLRAAVRGLTRDELTARPGPGAWSILEVVVHIADSDAISIDRMKRILTEDNPPLLYADESAYVANLFTHDQDIEDALALLEIGRRQWARVLRKLPDEAFARTGQHNRRGAVSLGQLVGDYIRHVDEHLEFVRGKRQNLGKPL
ncbi:MAG: DinB family protein [Gemmataceae bacterium]|nr:DinB family protein [Gemmataceae bacterium]